MSSQPPRIPETFEELTRAINLLRARTIPGRLNADGEVHLTAALGVLPSVEDAQVWAPVLTEALERLREAGGEPAEPPQLPQTQKQLKAAIELLQQSVRPEGISSRTARVRLHQLMGGIYPSPTTAIRWQAALEAHMAAQLAPRAPASAGGGNRRADKKRPGGPPVFERSRVEPTIAVTRRPVSDKLRPKVITPKTGS
jgi:hypothetical protein